MTADNKEGIKEPQIRRSSRPKTPKKMADQEDQEERRSKKDSVKKEKDTITASRISTNLKSATKSQHSNKKRKRISSPPSGSASSKPRSDSQARKKLKMVREIRKKRKKEIARELAATKKKDTKSDDLPSHLRDQGNIICSASADSIPHEEEELDPSDFYWEVERVVGRRVHKKRVEYLIRWKGCPDDQNTWEPSINLCDTAMVEAKRYDKEEKEKERKRMEDEKKLFDLEGKDTSHSQAQAMDLTESTLSSLNADDKAGMVNSKSNPQDKTITGDKINSPKDPDQKESGTSLHISDMTEAEKQWKWTDEDHVRFQPVMRINVNDSNAKDIITEARMNGTPVVLVGHKGWANFAKRWLKRMRKKRVDSDALNLIPDCPAKKAEYVLSNSNKNSTATTERSESTLTARLGYENDCSRNDATIKRRKETIENDNDYCGSNMVQTNSPSDGGLKPEDTIPVKEGKVTCGFVNKDNDVHGSKVEVNVALQHLKKYSPLTEQGPGYSDEPLNKVQFFAEKFSRATTQNFLGEGSVNEEIHEDSHISRTDSSDAIRTFNEKRIRDDSERSMAAIIIETDNNSEKNNVVITENKVETISDQNVSHQTNGVVLNTEVSDKSLNTTSEHYSETKQGEGSSTEQSVCAKTSREEESAVRDKHKNVAPCHPNTQMKEIYLKYINSAILHGLFDEFNTLSHIAISVGKKLKERGTKWGEDCAKFICVLFTHLKQKDKNMYVSAKAIVQELLKTKKECFSAYISIIDSLEIRLKDLIGLTCWEKINNDFNLFSEEERVQKLLSSNLNNDKIDLASQQKEIEAGEPEFFEDDGSPLDLAHPLYSWELDVQKMIDDMGMEDVPVVRRNYNENNPIQGIIRASKFLKTCWPSPNSGSDSNMPSKSGQLEVGNACVKDAPSSTKSSTSSNLNPSQTRLYLHQWQFPLSDTAGRKLCHDNVPLPDDIFGEDILKYWLDLPQCKSDSPLQYIFMGREETLSKLHKDNGGLAITIAPIVGEKECVLVHRADGSNCLYHLEAKLDDIDLHAYPLLSQARIWRTIVKPGEILLMPQGTYHQCRNLTPCLSYSRFHLDTVNLLPFYQSMIDGDAPELEHGSILWNCATELIRKVDIVVDNTQSALKKRNGKIHGLTEEIVSAVKTLKTLRHIVREAARQTAVRNAVKGNCSKKAVSGSGALVGSIVRHGMKAMPSLKGGTPSKSTFSMGGGGLKISENEDDDHDWDMLVDDIDLCLHEFRYRRLHKMPIFRKQRTKDLENAISLGKEQHSSATVVAYNTKLDNAYLSLPLVDASRPARKYLADDLIIGEKIKVKLQEKKATAEVLQIVKSLPCAFISFEDYPSLYDEFQPYDALRTPNSGEKGMQIPAHHVKAGLVVVCLLPGDGGVMEEYRGIVKYITCETMLKVRLNLGLCKLERWVTSEFVLERTVEMEALKLKSTGEVVGEMGVV